MKYFIYIRGIPNEKAHRLGRPIIRLPTVTIYIALAHASRNRPSYFSQLILGDYKTFFLRRRRSFLSTKKKWILTTAARAQKFACRSRVKTATA